jgi:hypothetical protein
LETSAEHDARVFRYVEAFVKQHNMLEAYQRRPPKRPLISTDLCNTMQADLIILGIKVTDTRMKEFIHQHLRFLDAAAHSPPIQVVTSSSTSTSNIQ